MGFPQLPEDKQLEIVEKYRSGLSTQAIAKEFYIAQSYARKILLRKGITLRSKACRARRYSLREDAFKTITEESAYWCGFIMGDGCLFENSVILGINKKDEQHLDKLKRWLGYDIPLYRYKNIVTLKIHSKALVGDLQRFGLTPAKSHTAKVISLENNRDYWRGLLDADGSVFFQGNHPRLALVGSLPTLEQYSSYTKKLVPKSKASIVSVSSIYRVSYHGTFATPLIKHFYEGAGIYLDRKFQLASLVIGGKC